MKQKIEQVIAELEEDFQRHLQIYNDKWADRREYHDGASDAYLECIEKLKAVIADETDYSRNLT